MTWSFRRPRDARWRDVRIAVIGCGTIAEAGHVPALKALRLAPAVLADRDGARARALAAEAGGRALAVEDYRDHLDAFDAAIVALPHHLHAPVTTDLLRHGKHVLLEKPMAVTPEECEQIVEAARASQGVLAIGMIRHFWQNAQWVRDLIRQGSLGEVQSFDIRDGARAISIASEFALRPEMSGGGVLMNLGVHVLDEILWWLGPVESFEYRDDSYGGNEVNAELDLRLVSGARGTVELSFNRQLRGTAIITGTQGELEVELYGHGLKATPDSLLDIQAGGRVGREIPPSSTELAPIFARELADWLDAIVTGGMPRVPGDEHHVTLARLVQDCYANRRELELPWMRPALAGTQAEVPHAV